jgi:hypothetical protein
MRRWVAALVLVTGCHFYVEDGDDDTALPDASPGTPDASPFLPDASPVTPDAAEACETLADFYARFGECMSFADWQAAGMCDVPNEPTSMGACSACHADGTGATYLSPDCNLTFAATRQMTYIRGLVVGVADAEGCFNGLAPEGRWLDRQNDPMHTPVYSFAMSRVDSINNFFATTFARYADSTFDCSP